MSSEVIPTSFRKTSVLNYYNTLSHWLGMVCLLYSAARCLSRNILWPWFIFLFNMEKFLVKRQRLCSQSEDAHCENTTSDSPGPSNSFKVPSQTNSSCAVRKYHDCYLNYRFTYNGSEHHPCPECVVCGEKLCHESMVPSKLKRHFNTKQSHLIGKDTAYLSRLFSSPVKQVKSMVKTATIAKRRKYRVIRWLK
jgi:hypothetical protein